MVDELTISTQNLLFHIRDDFLQSLFSQNNLMQFILRIHRTLLKSDFLIAMQDKNLNAVGTAFYFVQGSVGISPSPSSKLS